MGVLLIDMPEHPLFNEKIKSEVNAPKLCNVQNALGVKPVF